MKKRGRKKITDPAYLASKEARLTFRVEPDLIMKFKAIAAMKKMNIEELGAKALKDLFKKEKKSIEKWTE